VNSLVKETKARLYAPGRDVILKIGGALPVVRRAFPELAGTLAFVVSPLMLLILLAMVGACFPKRHYTLNNEIWYYWLSFSGVLVGLVFAYELWPNHWSRKLFWEEVFLRVWLIEAIGGIAFGGFCLFLGLKGSWVPIIVNWESERKFICLTVLSVCVGLLGLVGRLYIRVKTLMRGERYGAALAAGCLMVLFWIVAGILIPPMSDVFK